MRILHFSDPHLHSRLGQMSLGDWFSKRAVGTWNVLRGRARRFDLAGPKLAALAEFSRQQEIELVICTGDYTALGLDTEWTAARRGMAGATEGDARLIVVIFGSGVRVEDIEPLLSSGRLAAHRSTLLEQNGGVAPRAIERIRSLVTLRADKCEKMLFLVIALRRP